MQQECNSPNQGKYIIRNVDYEIPLLARNDKHKAFIIRLLRFARNDGEVTICRPFITKKLSSIIYYLSSIIYHPIP